MRPKRNELASDYLERVRRAQEATAKAAANDGALTIEDISSMEPEAVSQAMAAGQLAHLGFPAPRARRR